MKEHQKVAHGVKSVCHNNKKNHAMGSQDPGSQKKAYTDGGAEKGKIGKMLAAVGACNEEGALDQSSLTRNLSRWKPTTTLNS